MEEKKRAEEHIEVETGTKAQAVIREEVQSAGETAAQTEGRLQENVGIEIELTPVINYALQQNRMPIIREILVKNNSVEPLENITLKLWSEPEMTSDFSQNLDRVEAGGALVLRGVGLNADGEFLAGLTERINGVLYADLLKGETILCREKRELSALAFDEWHGTAFFPELLTAFVTPNHPEVVKVNARAAELLGRWSKDPSLNAYQTQNPNRVLMQAAAVYGALQEENIVYSVPPASFEAVGQRVRLCDAVIRQKMGTCLDLTLFYASCLEAIGLHPLLLLQKGHIFAGLWLEDSAFAEAVSDDPALITKRLADGINEIVAVECTALVSGSSVSFDEARTLAEKNLGGEDSLEYIIDVSRARVSGIRPLPLRMAADGRWRIVREKRSKEELTRAPEQMEEAVLVREGKTAGVSEQQGKFAQWERKLLDLGLRNTLINLRFSRNVIPILSASLAELEDALAEGDEYGIGPRPAEWDIKEGERRDMERMGDLGPFKALIRSEFQNKRLRTILNEGELGRAIVGLYRASRTSLEENGANTLYLSLGLLRWYEGKTSEKARYAPIVLLPVEIVRKSANKGYVIRLRDDEPQMNITLLEMLKQDFGITISGLDTLPQDEHGVDMRRVFSVLRQAVMDEKRWDVVETAVLGIFSFSQFVMWNDMRTRAEELKKNKIVRSLIDGRLSWNALPMAIGDWVEEDGVKLPLPADASQLFAIEAAAKGQSFVLHGPPGTGKSQTITTLIANALAQGKTVLFVAEKMAALSVVQRRLAAIGIGPFCLELHSNKSRKRDVLNQLKTATEVVRMEPGREFEKKAEQAAKLRAELDAYARALHVRQKSGLTVFEMVERYEDSRAAGDEVKFSAQFAASLDTEGLERQEILAERLIAAARAVGHPFRHELSPVSKTVYSQQLRTGLEGMLPLYRLALEEMSAAGDLLDKAVNRPRPESFAQWEKLSRIAAGLKQWAGIPKAWAGFDKIWEELARIREMADHYQAAAEWREKLLAGWKEEFLGQDGAALKAQWELSSNKWCLSRFLGQNKLIKAVSPFAREGVSKETLGIALEQLEMYHKELTAGKILFEKYGEGLGGLYTGEDTDWKKIADLTQTAGESAEVLDELTGSVQFRKKYAGLKENFAALERFLSIFEKVRTARDQLHGMLEISVEEVIDKEDTADEQISRDDWLFRELVLCAALRKHSSELKEWIVWKNTCREAGECGLEPLVRAYEEGLEHEAAMGAYHKALYRELIISAIDADPVLNTFSGAVFEEKIEQFKRIDKEMTKASRTEIFCRLAARIPGFTGEAAHSSEVGILQRAIRSNGRGLSIRRLFEQIPNLLPRLCPCMLMSPISAAQYLDPGREPFDIVVFDEASQMPTCQAVGVLARGKDAVIVGDPKQMPPTSFFTGNTEDEEHLEQEDLESILDDCLALNMPQTHLLWHYRSRHESLIAFSNSRFYENRLYTFPSVNDRESKVKMVSVDGFFDRGKTRQNRAEAEAVVRELSRRCHDFRCAGQSVGVVTFNIQQQNLIEDLLTEECKKDASLEEWAFRGEEPIFIKNLENVQGDERDVILFSIGYGPDKSGKVYMNFGPLNREGGWRRLNVAVSRARQEMVVFTALKAEQLDLSRTCAEGVSALKAFLKYTETGKLTAGLADAGNDGDKSVSYGIKEAGGIAKSLCAQLAVKGYATQRMVGHSQFRIDVGVIDPGNPERYILGIMLDGFSYRQAKTTRDREQAQIAVLNSLGWEIHRLWSIDWWDNSEKEFKRILDHLKALEENAARAKKEAERREREAVEAERIKENNKRIAGEAEKNSEASQPAAEKAEEKSKSSQPAADKAEEKSKSSQPAAEKAEENSEEGQQTPGKTAEETVRGKHAETSVQMSAADRKPEHSGQSEGIAGKGKTEGPRRCQTEEGAQESQREERQDNRAAQRQQSSSDNALAAVKPSVTSDAQPQEKAGARSGKKVANKAFVNRLTSYGFKKMDLGVVAEEAAVQEKQMPQGARMYQAARFPERILTPDDYILPENTQLLRETIEAVLEAEAPVSEGLLTKRVLQSFGIARSGARLQGRTDELMKRMHVKFTVLDKQKFYWLPSQNPEEYQEFRIAGSGIDRREAKDLPVEETSNAVCAVLKEQIGLPKEDMVRETAKILGYTRTGNIVTAAVLNGIRYALEKGKIREDKNGYLTLNE